MDACFLWPITWLGIPFQSLSMPFRSNSGCDLHMQRQCSSSSAFCVKDAPNPSSEASVCKLNGRWISGQANTGACVSRCFNSRKASSCFGFSSADGGVKQQSSQIRGYIVGIMRQYPENASCLGQLSMEITAG